MKAVGTVRCSECDALVAGYVPRGGDGSGLHAFRHAGRASFDDPRSARSCAGSYRLAKPRRPDDPPGARS